MSSKQVVPLTSSLYINFRTVKAGQSWETHKKRQIYDFPTTFNNDNYNGFIGIINRRSDGFVYGNDFRRQWTPQLGHTGPIRGTRGLAGPCNFRRAARAVIWAAAGQRSGNSAGKQSTSVWGRARNFSTARSRSLRDRRLLFSVFKWKVSHVPAKLAFPLVNPCRIIFVCNKHYG